MSPKASRPTFAASTRSLKRDGNRSSMRAFKTSPRVPITLCSATPSNTNPTRSSTNTLQYEYALIDGDLVYSFRFIADGSHMAMGIVQVIYVDHETISFSS